MSFRYDGEDSVGQPAFNAPTISVATGGKPTLGGARNNSNRFAGYTMAPSISKGTGAMAVTTQLAIQPPSWMKPAAPAGVSVPDEEMDFLPFTEQLNGGVIDPTHLELQFLSFPQRPFRGERLVVTAFSAAVADPLSLLDIDPAIYVGATQVGATQGKMPASMFVPNAFGVRLSFPEAGQGTRIFVPIVARASPGAGNTIVVSVGVIGRAMR